MGVFNRVIHVREPFRRPETPVPLPVFLESSKPLFYNDLLLHTLAYTVVSRRV